MRAYVAVGANLGDRWARLAEAARALRAAPGVAVVRASRAWDTEPVGPPQPRYLNAVLELETTRPPASLLALLQEIERAAGRRRDVRWGARTLDLDLLLVGRLEVHGPGLDLPHPRIADRRFVLAPLAELVPELRIPGIGRNVAALLEEAPALDLAPAGAYPL
ncbi:MAG TPA: 2-amino-4-hydroxy-6-hydroxymethyldihydropteridine diphosphokinase [Anaeromyxobacteraceae bacterium]|nr:2-amino-4-hydroxy-6-hydroxymethyldihydropteridine diphosphokinase [Anaeromyxobacteraceae bacterium]